MNIVFKQYVSCFLLLAVCVTDLRTQVRSSYDQLSGPGARSNAMADAVVSDARDLSIMYRNPAGLMFLQRASFFMDHQQRTGHTLMGETIGFLAAPGDQNRLAVGVTVEHRGNFFGPNNEEIRTRQLRFDITEALWIVSGLSVGLRAGVTYAGSNQFQHWGLNTILGVQYVPGPEVSYAMTLGGLGTTISKNTFTSTEAETGSNPKVLQVGLTMRFPSAFSQQVFILALANEKVFGTPGLAYKAGMEYYPARFLALRAGVTAGPLVKGVSAGAGLRLGRIHFDAAVFPSYLSTRLHQASVTLEF